MFRKLLVPITCLAACGLPTAGAASGSGNRGLLTDQVWIRGRLHGRRLRGTIRVRDRSGRARCDSRWVRFHATHVGG